MTTTIKIIRKANGIEELVKTVECETKAQAKIMVETFSKESAYFIDDDNEYYAYI